jgi:hypothetical protein
VNRLALCILVFLLVSDNRPLLLRARELRVTVAAQCVSLRADLRQLRRRSPDAPGATWQAILTRPESDEAPDAERIQ